MHHIGVFVSYDYQFFDEVTGKLKFIKLVILRDEESSSIYKANNAGLEDSSLRSEWQSRQNKITFTVTSTPTL